MIERFGKRISILRRNLLDVEAEAAEQEDGGGLGELTAILAEKLLQFKPLKSDRLICLIDRIEHDDQLDWGIEAVARDSVGAAKCEDFSRLAAVEKAKVRRFQA